MLHSLHLSYCGGFVHIFFLQFLFSPLSLIWLISSGFFALFHLVADFALVLLVVSACTCFLAQVAQYELLVNSLSNLASRVLIAWQQEKAWL
jgi:hypothetical protein